MPKTHQPRSGSMAFWPRKRSKRATARVRSWNREYDARPLGFPAYKAGMTHIMAEDQSKGNQGEQLHIPITILECPPMKIFGIRAYVPSGAGVRVAKELLFKSDKELALKIDIKNPKVAKDIDALKPEEYSYFSILVHTQPKMTGIGKKVPDVIELQLGGKPAEQLVFIKEHLSTPISVSDIFKEGERIDTHAVTKGKGFQGPVKRFGIGLKHHKSEKGRRFPGAIGTWVGQQHNQHRVAYAGQEGYHLRTQYNNPIYSLGDKPEEIKIKGGIINYGEVKSPYIFVKGTIQGPKKRLITLTKSVRGMKHAKVPPINSVHLESHQGV